MSILHRVANQQTDKTWDKRHLEHDLHGGGAETCENVWVKT